MLQVFSQSGVFPTHQRQQQNSLVHGKMQYPDTILISREPTFTFDAEGDGQASGVATTFSGSCRAEVAGSNPILTGSDGKEVKYSWIIYMPKTTERFAYGDKVTVTEPDGGVYVSTLKQQSNGQFNTRLWV